MSTGLLLLYALTFFITLWLGFYLIARDFHKRPLLLTGFGLGFYAAAIMMEVLQDFSPDTLIPVFAKLHTVFIYLPALCWTGVLIFLIPEFVTFREQAKTIWQKLLFPASLTAIFIHAFTPLPPGILAGFIGLPLAAAFILLLSGLRESPDRPPLGLALLATIFFGLAIGLALPLTWLPRAWVVLSIGVDMLCLGLGIAIFDAFDEGHRLQEDMIRSLVSALLLSMLFSIQIALAITLIGNLSFALVVLLFSTLSTTTAIATLPRMLTPIVQKLLPIGSPKNRQNISELRATAAVLDRLNPVVNFERMSEADFQRLTRKALSYLGDLPRLSTSPLMFLPQVAERLENQNGQDNTLDRAQELKALLTESVFRLKPPGDAEFGDTDAWRYFNALYFPYVVGLKPFRRYQDTRLLSDGEKLALEWFRTQVPERTLYNWQSAAAKLIAADLQDQLAKNP